MQLHTSAVHCLREIFLKVSLKVEIEPYTLNNERWVSDYVTATYFQQYLIVILHNDIRLFLVSYLKYIQSYKLQS